MAQSRRADKAQQAAPAGAGPRILKKYPNRRLYDTEISSYITLSDVKAMVLKGTAFEVRDAKTGEDLTRSILLQIILEEETGGVRFAAGACLAALSIAAGAATPARSASAPAPATAGASAASAAPSAPVEFVGLLEAGTTYIAEVAYDSRALRTWRPVKEVRVA